MGFLKRLMSLFGLNPSADALTRKGNALVKKDEPMSSVELFKKALEIDPVSVAAYDGLGRAYFKMGFREEAEREFNIADGLERLASDPTDLEAAIKLGWAMLDKNLYRQIIPLLDPVYERYAGHKDLLLILAMAAKGAGHDKRARELLKVGLQRWPRVSDFYMHMGNMEIKSGNRKEGERLVEIARLMGQADGNLADAQVRLELAKVFYQQKRYGDAAEFMRQAVNVDRSNGELWTFLGDCYFRAGLYPAAVDALKQATKFTPSDPRPQNLLAQAFQFMGKFDESKAAKQVAQVLEGGQNQQNTAPEAAKFIKYLLSIGQTDEARKHLADGLGKWPDNGELMLIQGRFMVKDGQFEEAVSVLKKVVEERDNWAEPHIWLAMAYQKMGDTMSALAEGQLATRLAPRSPVIHKLYGDILREQKKFGMAENAYETAENLKYLKRR